MKTIKLGDPMPDPCRNCGLKYGYQVDDMCRRGYTNIVLEEDEEASSETNGTWSDWVKTTKYGTRAYCANCHYDLKLKVDRNE